MKASLPSPSKAFPLSGGGTIPSLGFGTWRSKPSEVKDAVKTALKVGYRHIDCAYIYGNEAAVGEAIAESQIPRDQLWITSKLWNSFHSPDKVRVGIQETLKALRLDSLDLYLMHWPVAFKYEGEGIPPNQPKDDKGEIIVDYQLTEDPLPTWRALEQLAKEGLVKHIGVSNFNIRRLEQLLAGAKIKPAVNQVELNLRCAQPDLVKWAKENGIVLEAYSPLGSVGAPQLQEPVVKSIAEKHGITPAQVLISWQLARGVVCLPKSVTPERIASNFKVVDLAKEDIEALEAEAASKPTHRTVNPAWGGVDIFEDQVKSNL